MGNCISTLRKKRNASAPKDDAIPLGVMSQDQSKENEHNPPNPSATGGDETTFPTGDIQLPAGVGPNSGDSVQTTMVESANSQRDGPSPQDEAPQNNATPSGDGATPSNDDAMSPGAAACDDSINDAALEEAEIHTARPTSILRVGPARIVSTRSTGNVRAASFRVQIPSLPRLPFMKQSATMSDINKPLPKYPNNDPVTAYIDHNTAQIQNARQKWAQFNTNRPREAFKQGNEKEQIAQIRQEMKKTKAPPILHMVPFFDPGDPDKGPVGELGILAPTHARAPSHLYMQQIRDMSGQSLHIASPRHAHSMNQLRGNQNVSPVSPGTPNSALVSPPTPSGRFPPRGSSAPSGAVGPSSNAHPSDVNARRGLARLSEMKPAKQLSAVEERHPKITPDAHVALPNPETKEPQNSPEGEQEKTEDDELWKKALGEVGQTLMKARARILNKVRKHVEDETHAAYITEAILGMADDIVDECAHADNADSQHLIRNKVEEVRQTADAEMKIEATTDADLEYCAGATAKLKAAALVDKWKAEARETVEAAQKGKGKVADDAVEEEEEGRESGDSSESSA
ncbi:hypothetical protein F4781DRAFT_430928 [Annulohypoxylon bovei var. microspora]|nr:hypothetical protein F4781DRAFT_430928 [Annulohypoxylon bovei var. microspora]